MERMRIEPIACPLCGAVNYFKVGGERTAHGILCCSWCGQAVFRLLNGVISKNPPAGGLRITPEEADKYGLIKKEDKNEDV